MRTSFRVKTTTAHHGQRETLRSFERAWYAWVEAVWVNAEDDEPRDYDDEAR